MEKKREISWFRAGKKKDIVKLRYYPENCETISRPRVGKGWTDSEADIFVSQLKGIQDLYDDHKRHDDPVYSGVDDLAYKMWFGDDKPHHLKVKDDQVEQQSNGASLVFEKLIGHDKRDSIIQKQAAELKQLKEQVQTLTDKLTLYEGDIRVQQAETARKLPDNDKALKKYYTDIKTERALSNFKGWTNKNGFTVNDSAKYQVVMRLKKYFGDRNLLMLDCKDITEYLQVYIGKEERPNPATSWNRERRTISYFYKWAQFEYNCQSPMPGTKTKSDKDNNHEIEWLNLNEIKFLLDYINTGNKELDLYWRTATAIMCFAGLSAHELRALHTSNVDLDKMIICVRPCEIAKVSLKNIKRNRNIMINDLLKPYIEAYLKTKFPSKHLFIDLRFKDNRPWNKKGFSWAINGEACKNKPGVFPDEINDKNCGCLILRRSFGSLMIRSGKTFAEVAALMGNSINMVELHYGRLKANEVDSSIDVSKLLKEPKLSKITELKTF